MVSFLRSDDPKCERFGALGVANLALYPSNHQELIEDGSLTALCGVIGSKI